ASSNPDRVGRRRAETHRRIKAARGAWTNAARVEGRDRAAEEAVSGRPRKTAQAAARRLRRNLQGDERASCHHSHTRPPASRVSSAHRRGDSKAGKETQGQGSGALDQGPISSRSKSNARTPRLPSRHSLSRDNRDAGSSHLRSSRPRAKEGSRGPARNNDPA